MRYILSLKHFIFILIYLIILFIFIYLYYPIYLKEHFDTNFLPFFRTNIKNIPFIQYNYGDATYNRQNLIKGNIPYDENTLFLGIRLGNKNTLHKYIINHLMKKILLYQTKQFKLIDIDYDNDYQVLLDLNQNKINYGLVSSPVLYDYLITRHQVNQTNLEFMTTLTKNFIYGITLDNTNIYNIHNLKDATIGISKHNATERLVLKDFLNHLGCNHQLRECDHTEMNNLLHKGLIDFYIIIDEFPSDNIRSLLSKNPRIRLVDMGIKDNDNFMRKYSYERVILNVKLLEYSQKNLYTHDAKGIGRYLPQNTPVKNYDDFNPHILTYQFPNCLLTNTSNRIKGNYEFIRDIFRRLSNNRKYGLSYLPGTKLQRHIKPGVTNLPIPMHPDVIDFHNRVRYNPEFI